MENHQRSRKLAKKEVDNEVKESSQGRGFPKSGRNKETGAARRLKNSQGLPDGISLPWGTGDLNNLEKRS